MKAKDKLWELYLKGLKAEEAGDYRKAFKLWSQGVKLGDPAAMNCLAIAYGHGYGVSQNKQKALVWFKRAVKLGHNDLHSNIALTYASMGQYPKAIHWLQKGVDAGDGGCALQLAKLLLKIRRREAWARILELLTMAVCCRVAFDISAYEHEEAQELLDKLNGEGYV